MARERGALRGANQGVPHGSVLREVHRSWQQVREGLSGNITRHLVYMPAHSIGIASGVQISRLSS